ncbi:sensor histidine kinase [Actinomadura macrotermitis]|nr:sensor histidine kinase [Actinomadura macrotermitis]
MTAPVISGNLTPLEPDKPLWWATMAGVVALGGAVAVSRSRPLVLLVVSALFLPVQGNFAFSLPVAAYLAGRRTPHARPVVWVFTAMFTGGTLFNIVRGIDVTTWFPLTIWFVVIGVLPWLTGRYWRQYQELVRAGWERAERLEREQRIVAERERMRERARIAQDMHDSLGHELALIAVRAGALQVAPDLDERHRAAAAELRAGAADATDRLRDIIGVLREDAPQDAAPVRESIADLVERARASGMPVRLAGSDVAGGAPMVALAAHRVVQEALTNAAKHAPGADVTVRVERSGGRSIVTVVNGPAAGPVRPAVSGGHGLTGLDERVRLVGGTLRAGPDGAGGFAVTAELPDVPAPARPESESAWHLARGRQEVRRGLITAITVPAALVAFLSAIMLGYYAYATFASVLHPADYAALRVGQPRTQVERVLPEVELLNAGDVRYRFAPPPQRARCAYYRSDGNLLGLGTVYRLCFADGRLAAKDAAPPPREGDR